MKKVILFLSLVSALQADPPVNPPRNVTADPNTGTVVWPPTPIFGAISIDSGAITSNGFGALSAVSLNTTGFINANGDLATSANLEVFAQATYSYGGATLYNKAGIGNAVDTGFLFGATPDASVDGGFQQVSTINISRSAGGFSVLALDGVTKSPLTALLFNGNTITTGTGTLTLGSVILNAGAGGTLGSNAFTSTSYQPLDAALTALAGGSDFVAFSGPTTSNKTFALPDASATILTTNAAVTAAQGGTGLATYTIGDLLYADGATSIAKLSGVATGNVLLSGGVGAAPSLGKVTTAHTTGVAASGANTDITGLAPVGDLALTPGGGYVNVTGTVVTTKSFDLPTTTNSTTGVLRLGGSVLFHGYGGNMFFGNPSGNYSLTGIGNFGMGTSVLGSLTTGANNIAMGYQSSTAMTTGYGNTGIGYQALLATTTGAANVALGFFAGNAITTGDFNVLIGYDADVGVNNLTNAIAIGRGAIAGASNTMSLGGAANPVDVILGGTTASAKLHVIKTTEQFRFGYDASNYGSFLCSSAADIQFFRNGTGYWGVDSTGFYFGTTAAKMRWSPTDTGIDFLPFWDDSLGAYTNAAASDIRTIAGLGTSATVNTGTSGPTIPLMSTANNFSLQQIFRPENSYSIADTNPDTGAGGGIVLGTSAGSYALDGYGAGLSFSGPSTNRRRAGMAVKYTGADADQAGLAFFVRSSTVTGADDLIEGMELDHLGNLTLQGTNKFQNGSASGVLFLGADVAATTLTADVRKYGAIMAYRYGSATQASEVVSVDATTTDTMTLFLGGRATGANRAAQKVSIALTATETATAATEYFSVTPTAVTATAPLRAIGNRIGTTVTTVGNVGAGDDTLWTQSVAGATLANTGESLEWVISGRFATSANTKRLRVKFGATTILDTGALAVTTLSEWTARGSIVRANGTSQRCASTFSSSSSVLTATASYETASETLSSSSDFTVTGESGSSADDDITILVGKILLQ